MDVGESERHLGRDARVDDTLPLGALLLDAHERLVHVGNVDTGPHVLLRQSLEATTVRATHRRGVAARRVRVDELRERTLEHGRAEAIERLADPLQELEVGAELGDGLERTHAGLRDELVPALEEARDVLRVQLAGQVVRGTGVFGPREAHAVPGRVVGAEAELAQARRGGQGLRGGVAPTGEPLQGGEIESRRRGGSRGKGCQRSQGPQHVECRHAQRQVRLGDGGTVVAQHRAQAHQRVVDLGDLGLLGLLVAADRTDEVAAHVGRGHREARQPDTGEAVTDAVERGAARADHQHALACVHALADRVDDRLGAARTGKRVDRERVPGGDPGEDAFLLGIRVEKKSVGRGGALVGARDHRIGATDRDPGTIVGVPGQGVEQRIVEVLRGARHAGADVGERRDDQARVHDERRDVRRQPAKVVDDRLRLEDALVVREAREGRAVDRDAEMRAEGARQFGVHHEGAVQLEFEVAVVAADGERPQQHRGRPLHSPDLPRGEPHGQVHRLETARGAQFDVLRRDALGGDPRGAQRHLVAEEVGQQGCATGDELRQRAGVRLGDVDARVDRVVEPQERGTTAEGGRFRADAVAFGVGDVTNHDAGLRQSQLARIDRRRNVAFGARHDAVLSSPHTCQTKPGTRRRRAAGPSFAGLRDTPRGSAIPPQRGKSADRPPI